MLVIDLDPSARAHLQRALAAHAAWCRANGRRLPAALDALISATNGQERPSLAAAADMADADDVPAQPLLYTLGEAGQRLHLSERTLRRLAEDGKLPTVRVGAAVRVHHADLVAFAERLREESACASSSGAAP